MAGRSASDAGTRTAAGAEAETETETAEEGGESLAGETGGLISWQGGEDEDEEGGELTGSAAGEGGRGHCPALPLPLPLPWRQAR